MFYIKITIYLKKNITFKNIDKINKKILYNKQKDIKYIKKNVYKKKDYL